MQFYLAPMEGISGYIYRNAVHDFFGDGITKYYTPFIAPRPKKGMASKERRGLLPENNQGIPLVPQILTNKAEDFLTLSEEICDTYGYEEINLNAGCPSKTVVSHGKGSGILKDTEAYDRFLDEIFAKAKCKISIKTRLGMEDPEEFVRLLEIYNQYPITELTIHPRLQTDQYKGTVRMGDFCAALDKCKMPVVYNGDIYTVQDYREKMQYIKERCKNTVCAVMLGRGMLRNPALARELYRSDLSEEEKAGAPSKEELRAYHDRIFTSYKDLFDGEMPLLFHMKELWASMGSMFPDNEKALKKIRKSGNVAEYLAGVHEIL